MLQDPGEVAELRSRSNLQVMFRRSWENSRRDGYENRNNFGHIFYVKMIRKISAVIRSRNPGAIYTQWSAGIQTDDKILVRDKHYALQERRDSSTTRESLELEIYDTSITNSVMLHVLQSLEHNFRAIRRVRRVHKGL